MSGPHLWLFLSSISKGANLWKFENVRDRLFPNCRLRQKWDKPSIGIFVTHLMEIWRRDGSIGTFPPELGWWVGMSWDVPFTWDPHHHLFGWMPPLGPCYVGSGAYHLWRVQCEWCATGAAFQYLGGHWRSTQMGRIHERGWVFKLVVVVKLLKISRIWAYQSCCFAIFSQRNLIHHVPCVVTGSINLEASDTKQFEKLFCRICFSSLFLEAKIVKEFPEDGVVAADLGFPSGFWLVPPREVFQWIAFNASVEQQENRHLTWCTDSMRMGQKWYNQKCQDMDIPGCAGLLVCHIFFERWGNTQGPPPRLQFRVAAPKFPSCSPEHVQGAETQQACCPGQNSACCSSMNHWFWQFFFVRLFHKVVKFHRKKWQDLSSSEFFGLPSLEQNCKAQNCLGAYWIRPCPAGGEKICPSGNPYDCCPVSWHTQIVR